MFPFRMFYSRDAISAPIQHPGSNRQPSNFGEFRTSLGTSPMQGARVWCLVGELNPTCCAVWPNKYINKWEKKKTKRNEWLENLKKKKKKNLIEVFWIRSCLFRKVMGENLDILAITTKRSFSVSNRSGASVNSYVSVNFVEMIFYSKQYPNLDFSNWQ